MFIGRRREADVLSFVNARPSAPKEQGDAGLHHLRLRQGREALLYVPQSACRVRAPLAVMLHGAGGNAQHGMELLRPYADDANLILLAPDSQKESWDVIVGGRYGPDANFIDECLQQVFFRYEIDPERIALGGFSDGASYALSLGLSNGDSFRYVLAFSPGFMAPVRVEDSPDVFVSHGTRDTVLPIDVCSRRLIPVLRSYDLRVEYREFDGPHTVPQEIRRDAVQLLTARQRESD